MISITPDATVYTGGVLYGATISVMSGDESLYTLHTSRYVRSGTSTMRLLAQGDSESACSMLFQELVAAGRVDAQGNVLMADATGETQVDAQTGSDMQAGGVA